MEEMHGAVGSTVHVVFGMVRVESGDELRVASCELRVAGRESRGGSGNSKAVVLTDSILLTSHHQLHHVNHVHRPCHRVHQMAT